MNRRANQSMAKSHETSFHSDDLASRNMGDLRRRGLMAICICAAPFGQSVPPLMGLSGSPSTWMMVGVVLRPPLPWT